MPVTCIVSRRVVIPACSSDPPGRSRTCRPRRPGQHASAVSQTRPARNPAIVIGPSHRGSFSNVGVIGSLPSCPHSHCRRNDAVTVGVSGRIDRQTSRVGLRPSPPSGGPRSHAPSQQRGYARRVAPQHAAADPPVPPHVIEHPDAASARQSVAQTRPAPPRNTRDRVVSFASGSFFKRRRNRDPTDLSSSHLAVANDASGRGVSGT